MIDFEFLSALCCPETRQALRPAEPALVERLNQQIARGSLLNRGGQAVQERIEGGLVRADEKFLYPIRRNIPALLTEEAIPLVAEH